MLHPQTPPAPDLFHATIGADGAVLDHPAVRRALHREGIRGDLDDLFGDGPPQSLQQPYFVAACDEQRHAKVMRKYAFRRANIRRAWNRLQRYMPELLRHDAPAQTVFEMSTAHGAVLEIARHFGHDILGNDYANMVFKRQGQSVATTRPLNDATFERQTDDWGYAITPDPDAQDWPYRHITESLNLPVKTFDGGHTPYPIGEKSVDVTICMQAIEHYCHPDHWLEVVAEFCRISRRSIFILLNPMQKRFADVDGYAESYHEARLNLRDYNENGFECVATHMHWGQANGFKLIARD